MDRMIKTLKRALFTSAIVGGIGLIAYKSWLDGNDDANDDETDMGDAVDDIEPDGHETR